MAMREAPRAPSVLGKIDQILAVFLEHPAPVGLSDLARLSDLPKATVYRLACGLTDIGILDRTPGGFSLGPRLFELGQRVPRIQHICRVGVPFVEDLYVATNETVYLSIRDGNEVLHLLKIRGHHGSDKFDVGGRLPVHCTATGRAILAIEPPEALEECISAGLKPMTRHTVVHPALLREVVSRARTQGGVAIEREEVRLGYGAAAAAFLTPYGSAVALGISAPLHNRNPEHFRQLLHACGRALSRALAGTPRATVTNV